MLFKVLNAGEKNLPFLIYFCETFLSTLSLMIKSFTFNAFSENTYILYDDTKEAVIIDPGFNDATERKKLTDFIAQNHLKVVRLLNTHCHLDHIMGNPEVVEKYGVGLEVHKDEILFLKNAVTIGMRWGMRVPEQPEPSAYIEDNDIISFGNTKLQVLLAPGHSPGSICFYNEEEKWIIAGDVLFYGSIGRTDLPGGNHQQLLDSIEKRLMTLPDDVKVYSGHGQTTIIGRERTSNPFLV